ncbi:MAG: TrbI/VirB10 family protein [Bryobacteraceae bacterium]|nr:TrbI/VirB10 family protein [Bryobacteraceae bacterium]
MNPRKFLNFLRSKTGLLILFLLATCVVLILANSRKNFGKDASPVNGKPGALEADSKKPQLIERITRDMVPFRPPTSDDKTRKVTTAPAKRSEVEAPSLPSISIVAETPSNERKPKELSENFAPFGRLIQCELIVTVDSSSINTPVIGLVTENVYHHGQLIIPVGTEVHGSAQVDRVRERIASDGRWTLVWQTGEELRVSGLALDREKEADNDGWGITDGSAGLRGRLIKRDELAEIKMFAATLLSGAAEAFTEKQATAFGSFAVPSLTNAPLQGAQSVLDRYANQIQQSIERDGFYVRVPAGKQFYLYVTQTMDRADAKLGGDLVAKTAVPTGSEATAASTSPQFRGSPTSPSPRISKPIQPNP